MLPKVDRYIVVTSYLFPRELGSRADRSDAGSSPSRRMKLGLLLLRPAAFPAGAAALADLHKGSGQRTSKVFDDTATNGLILLHDR